MLIVDPPSHWASSAAALDGMRHWPFRSEDAAMFFPRVVAFDRLRGRFELFAPCGVAAGMIARCDEITGRCGQRPKATTPSCATACARRGTCTNADRVAARRMPASTCCRRCASRRSSPLSPRTLASGSAAVSDWRFLSARRLALFVMTCVERGTRWMLFERNAQPTWTMARAQVEAFLDSLYSEGAFAGRSGEQSYFVVCDERINNEETMRAGKINLAFGFAATQTRRVPRVPRHASSRAARAAKAISVNRFANYSPSVDLEIESSILRGLVPLERGDEGDTVRMPRPATAPAVAPPSPLRMSEDSGTWAAAHAAERGSD